MRFFEVDGKKCACGGIRVAEFPPVNRDVVSGAEQVEHFPRFRRSISTSSDRNVERGALGKLNIIRGKDK